MRIGVVVPSFFFLPGRSALGSLEMSLQPAPPTPPSPPLQAWPVDSAHGNGSDEQEMPRSDERANRVVELENAREGFTLPIYSHVEDNHFPPPFMLPVLFPVLLMHLFRCSRCGLCKGCRSPLRVR